MILGVTATRGILTERQLRGLRARIADPSVTVVHHGDCVGGDLESHHFACELGKNIVVHPPLNRRFQALAHSTCELCWWRTVRLERQPYLARDWDIVQSVDEMVACPATLAPAPHSGTWTTIKYAREAGRKIEIIYP